MTIKDVEEQTGLTRSNIIIYKFADGNSCSVG